MDVRTTRMTRREQLISETLASKRQAEDLLRTLLAAKAPANGSGPASRDLYKQVTGSSSLDNAIVQVRRSIETIDRVLDELRGQTPVTIPNGSPARQARWAAPLVTVVASGAPQHL